MRAPWATGTRGRGGEGRACGSEANTTVRQPRDLESLFQVEHSGCSSLSSPLPTIPAPFPLWVLRASHLPSSPSSSLHLHPATPHSIASALPPAPTPKTVSSPGEGPYLNSAEPGPSPLPLFSHTKHTVVLNKGFALRNIITGVPSLRRGKLEPCLAVFWKQAGGTIFHPWLVLFLVF